MKHTQKGDLFTKIVLAIFKLNGLFTSEGDRITEEFQLSSAKWKIVSSLYRSETPLTVSQIAHSMGQTRQAVQRLVDVMLSDNVLRQLDNPNHKRAKNITLTNKGSQVFEKLEKKQIPWANQYSDKISGMDLEITLRTLEKLSLLRK